MPWAVVKENWLELAAGGAVRRLPATILYALVNVVSNSGVEGVDDPGPTGSRIGDGHQGHVFGGLRGEGILDDDRHDDVLGGGGIHFFR